MKRLIILLVSSFLGIVGAPEVLMASDYCVLTGLSNTGMTETVLVQEQPTQEESTLEEPAMEEPLAIEGEWELAPVYQAPVQVATPVYQEPANYISVGGRTIEIMDSNDTKNDAGKYAARYNEHFLYGHNSTAVFDVLYGVRTGDVFTIVYDGYTTIYQVRDLVVYRKTGDTTLRVDDANSSINGEDVPMKYVAKGQEKRNGAQYDVALMTCYGTSYGNGDASHRLVVFADAI